MNTVGTGENLNMIGAPRGIEIGKDRVSFAWRREDLPELRCYSQHVLFTPEELKLIQLLDKEYVEVVEEDGSEVTGGWAIRTADLFKWCRASLEPAEGCEPWVSAVPLHYFEPLHQEDYTTDPPPWATKGDRSDNLPPWATDNEGDEEVWAHVVKRTDLADLDPRSGELVIERKDIAEAVAKGAKKLDVVQDTGEGERALIFSYRVSDLARRLGDRKSVVVGTGESLLPWACVESEDMSEVPLHEYTVLTKKLDHIKGSLVHTNECGESFIILSEREVRDAIRDGRRYLEIREDKDGEIISRYRINTLRLAFLFLAKRFPLLDSFIVHVPLAEFERLPV